MQDISAEFTVNAAVDFWSLCKARILALVRTTRERPWKKAFQRVFLFCSVLARPFSVLLFWHFYFYSFVFTLLFLMAEKKPLEPLPDPPPSSVSRSSVVSGSVVPEPSMHSDDDIFVLDGDFDAFAGRFFTIGW
ncbi:hypothetical protein NE237_002679 [Protea cynaroides]|uniref:Uncharacterized protein n=1 Tax=Protea cynaroides TaxID=273540 RepID=A0A9Q0JTC8_9MAGN|nr:hypothetical protein NE237_002679 [Protea cynaroides]